MSTRHVHKFERLSDVAIFCACGQIKFADPSAECARPHWPTYVPYVYPSWPWTTPAPTIYPWIVTTGTAVSVPNSAGTTSWSDGDQGTYTLTSGSAS